MPGRRPVDILNSILKLYKETLDVNFEQYFEPPLQEKDITTEMREVIPEYILNICRWHNGYNNDLLTPWQFRNFLLWGEYVYSPLAAGMILNWLHDREQADEGLEGRPLRKDIISVFAHVDLQLGINTTTGKLIDVPQFWSAFHVYDIRPEDYKIDLVTFLEEKEMELKMGKIVMTREGVRLKDMVERELEHGIQRLKVTKDELSPSDVRDV